MKKSKLDKLIEEYHNLISRDHHKDRDCHFEISKCWEYGDCLGWVVSHYGYCHRENDEGLSTPFDTYIEAEKHLESLLIEWIKEENEVSDT